MRNRPGKWRGGNVRRNRDRLTLPLRPRRVPARLPCEGIWPWLTHAYWLGRGGNCGRRRGPSAGSRGEPPRRISCAGAAWARRGAVPERGWGGVRCGGAGDAPGSGRGAPARSAPVRRRAGSSTGSAAAAGASRAGNCGPPAAGGDQPPHGATAKGRQQREAECQRGGWERWLACCEVVEFSGG